MNDQPRAWRDGEVPSAEELELLVGWGTEDPWQDVPGLREYPGRDAADHARRLLGRAVNPDRPGAETLRRLARARGYDIERVAEPRARHRSCRWYSVYEHAFLLADDTEVCLYEVEHDLSPDGGLVCEVYPDQATLGRAAWQHARAHRGEA